MNILKDLFTSIRFLIIMTVILGGIYPAILAGAGQFLFHHQANGSLLMKGDKVLGSELLGQKFEKLIYFHGRPNEFDKTTGASGIDPYITLENALLQAKRVADSRHVSQSMIHAWIYQYNEAPWVGLFGENKVNFVMLNEALDRLVS
ncbi:MAG: potassium-transporting ATPase subunit C [Alphaproteobacteria bacterium]|nr:potassium-transporting ATPase subunit C [Alphaproteobacteria bacterium]